MWAMICFFILTAIVLIACIVILIQEGRKTPEEKAAELEKYRKIRLENKRKEEAARQSNGYRGPTMGCLESFIRTLLLAILVFVSLTILIIVIATA